MSLVLRIAATAAVVSCLAVSQTFAAGNELDPPLEQVVVTASRVAQPVSEVIGSVTVITREEIERRQVQSLQDLLRGEAGIDVVNNGGLGKVSSVLVRGGNAAQTLFLVNGMRLGSATLGTTALELIPVDQIERIEIVRGPRSSLYGSDAMGGVVQIFTRQTNGVEGSAGYGSYNTQNYSSGFGFETAGLRFNATGNYIQSDGFNACTGNPVTFAGCATNEPDDDGFRNLSGSARLGYAFGQVADIELSTLYAQGYTEYDGSFVNQMRFRESTPGLRLHLQPASTLSLTLAGGITQDKEDNLKDGQFKSRFDTEKRVSSLQSDWQPTSKQTITLGADYLEDVVNSSTNYAKTSRQDKGVFVQYLGKLSTQEVSASIRRDDNEQFGNYNTGNVGWKWFVLDRALAFNAGWGKAFHAPTFNDLYYPADQYSAGNPNLKPERSQSVELGATGAYTWLSWSLQTFSTKTTDLIDWTADPITFFYSPKNISAARVRGAELTLRGQWDKLNASLNYTYLDPRSRASGVNYDHLLARRARQSGRIDVGYDLGRAQVSTTINVAGPRYDDLANSNRLAGYTTVDFNTAVELCKAFTLQVKLVNFFDRQYQTAQYFQQEGRAVYVTLRYQASGK
jgi:vitamin B12 transporter